MSELFTGHERRPARMRMLGSLSDSENASIVDTEGTGLVRREAGVQILLRKRCVLRFRFSAYIPSSRASADLRLAECIGSKLISRNIAENAALSGARACGQAPFPLGLKSDDSQMTE